MTRPRELVPGNRYFLLNYYDDDLKVPFISTYFYEREDEGDDHRRMWLFREPTSDSPGGVDKAVGEQEAEPPVLTAIHEDQLYQLLDLNGLIASLGELVDLHPLHALHQAAPDSLDARTDIPELDSVPAKVLGLEGRRSVTITIRYTDDGFSIGRNPEGLYASFFPKVHLEAEHERGIRAVFAKLGIGPDKDYLSQHGRVRVLIYPLPAERNFLETLAKELLLDVYRMRRADELNLSWNDFE